MRSDWPSSNHVSKPHSVSLLVPVSFSQSHVSLQDRATSVRKRVIAISEAVIRADLDHANAIALCRGILARAGDTEESIQVLGRLSLLLVP